MFFSGFGLCLYLFAANFACLYVIYYRIFYICFICRHIGYPLSEGAGIEPGLHLSVIDHYAVRKKLVRVCLRGE